jgi:hypothetical protein
MTTTDEESRSQRVYSEDELRSAVNAATPMDAFEIVLSLFQRMTLALESIALSMQEPPTVLFEQAPSSDGLGMAHMFEKGDDKGRRDDDDRDDTKEYP